MHRPGSNLVLLTLIVCSGFGVGCRKKNAVEKAVPPATISLTDSRFGLLSKVPDTADYFFGAYDLNGVAGKFLHSEFVQGLLRNPLVAESLATQGLPSEATAIVAQLRAHSPEFLKTQDLLTTLVGSECFVYMPQGSAAVISTLQEVLTSLRLAQVDTALSVLFAQDPGAPTSEQDKAKYMMANFLPRIGPLLAQSHLPSVMAGFKAGELKPKILEKMTALLPQLPAEFERSRWSPVNGSTALEKIVLHGDKLLTAEHETALRDALKPLVELSGDAELPQRWVEAIRSRRLEIAFGYEGEYLLIAIAEDLNTLNWNAGATSLATSGKLKNVASVAGPGTHTIEYASADLIRTSILQLRLAEIFTIVSPYLGGLIDEAESLRITQELQQLDARSTKFIPSEAADYSAILNVNDNIRYNAYGGVIPVSYATSATRVLSRAAFPDSILYCASSPSQTASREMFDWVSDLARLVDSTFETSVLPQMPPPDVQQFKTVEQVFLPMIAEAYSLVREFCLDITGDENAFVVDMRGAIPAVEGIPQQLHGARVLPRVCLAWKLAKPQDVVPWGNRGMQLLNAVAAFAPPDSNVKTPVPGLAETDRSNSKFYRAPMPLDAEDASPGVLLTKSGFLVLTMSPELDTSFAKLAAPSAVPAMELAVSFQKIAETGNAWLDLAVANKSSLLADQPPEKAVEFEKMVPSLRQFNDTLAALVGVRVTTGFSNGTWSHTFVLGRGAL